MDNQTLITGVGIEKKLSIDRQLKDDLMKDISPDDLSKIKRGFDLYRGTVQLEEFIMVMLHALYPNVTVGTRHKEILTFIQIFVLIDLKNLGKIKFQDFTNYLIDRQQGGTIVEQSSLFPAQDLNELELQADLVFPLQNSKYLAILENAKKNISLLEPKTYKSVEKISFGGVIINNIIYLPNDEAYCIATNDKHLNFYESTDNSLVRRFSVPENIHFLMYFQPTNRLITGSTNGFIFEWSVRKILGNMKKYQKSGGEKEKLPKVPANQIYELFLISQPIKQEDLTCINILEPLQLFITGSNDSYVRLYEMRNNGMKFSKKLQEHEKGIKGIAVSTHHKVIVSCAFDFDVLVWNAYLEHPVGRLKGHEAPLVSVYCPKDHQIILSLDARSVLKIWNSQRYHLIQNIQIFEKMPENAAIRFCYKEQSNLAIFYTKKLLFYKYSVNYKPKLTDDYDITAIKYSSKNLELYIGSYKSLKIWSIQTGVQKKSYVNIVESEITVIQVDERERKCFIGCLNGQIFSLDIFSGLLIQQFTKHDNQVSFLRYNNQHSLLITGGWDKLIKIHNDTHHIQSKEEIKQDPHKKQRINRLYQPRDNILQEQKTETIIKTDLRTIKNVSEKDLAGGSFSLEEMLIATFCKTNTIRLWDFEKGYLVAQYNLPADVTLLQFIRPFPLIIVCDSKGAIYIFSTKNHLPGPFKLLAQWKNMYSIQKTSQITFIKPFYNATSEECQIILGDEFGYIRIINITSFIQEHAIVPVPASAVANKKVYRMEEYDYKGVSESSFLIHDFMSFNDPNLIPPPNIKQKIQIKAHNERINFVTLVNESSQPLILSASSDRLVKLWNYGGDGRGVLKQGQKVNKSWLFSLSNQWENIQLTLFKEIKSKLPDTQEDYDTRKRMYSIPFTEAEKFEEATDEDIYKSLKEIDGYLQKGIKKKVGRFY